MSAKFIRFESHYNSGKRIYVSILPVSEIYSIDYDSGNQSVMFIFKPHANGDCTFSMNEVSQEDYENMLQEIIENESQVADMGASWKMDSIKNYTVSDTYNVT